MSKYFEDLDVGQTFESPGDRLMAREDIIQYARERDPQLYHIDEEAARKSPVGRFFASALHSMAVSQKLAHEAENHRPGCSALVVRRLLRMRNLTPSP